MNINFMMLIATFLVGISIGFSLLFKSNPKTTMEDNENFIENLAINEYAKQVWLRELKKETAPIFTKTWFLEYLQGERTASSAWFTWFLCLKFIFIFPIEVTKLFLNPSYLSNSIFLHSLFDSAVYMDMFLTTLGVYILWRCSKNSTKVWLWFARMYSVGALFKLVI